MKPLYFRLNQSHSKVFKYSSLDIHLKQWICTNISCRRPLSIDGFFCHLQSLVYTVEFPGVGQNFPKLVETATYGKLAKNP